MSDQTVDSNAGIGIEGLSVWRKAVDLAVYGCRDVLPAFPDHERDALTNQRRRSIQSVPAMIAEGHGRFYFQEAIRFCHITRCSLEEGRTQLVLAFWPGYLGKDIYQQLDRHTVEIRSLLNGYIAYLKRTKRGANEPGFSMSEQAGIYSANSAEKDLDQSFLPQNSELIHSELDRE